VRDGFPAAIERLDDQGLGGRRFLFSAWYAAALIGDARGRAGGANAAPSA